MDQTSAPPIWVNPIVVFLSAYRSGSSCTAGIMHHLGWMMGKKIKKPSKHNPTGFFEPAGFSNKLRSFFKERSLMKRCPSLDDWKKEWTPAVLRQKYMRRWMQEMQDECTKREAEGVGVKHPLMCVAIEDAIAAWGTDVRFVVNLRPVEDCANSLRRTGWSRTHASEVQELLVTMRDKFLNDEVPSLGVHYVTFEDLVRKPQEAVEALVGFLGMQPTLDQTAAAINFVQMVPDGVPLGDV